MVAEALEVVQCLEWLWPKPGILGGACHSAPSPGPSDSERLRQEELLVPLKSSLDA